MEKDQEFVEMVVKAIVDTPDKVKTERKVDEMGVLIELTVDPSDMGKIIGKEGRTAKSVRTLLRVLGAKERARVNLKIIEPEGGEGQRPSSDHSESTPLATPATPSAPTPSMDIAPDAVPEVEQAEEISPVEEEQSTGVF